jgi:hypothetical protein
VKFEDDGLGGAEFCVLTEPLSSARSIQEKAKRGPQDIVVSAI